MMNCRVCLKVINTSGRYPEYHEACVKKLFGSVSVSPYIELTSKGLIDQSRTRVKTAKSTKGKRFSISGVQIKMMASVSANKITYSESGGNFIVKPDAKTLEFPSLAANELLSMEVFRHFKFDVPECGLMSLSDGTFAYIIQRFDRTPVGPVHQEDLMQVMGIRNDKAEKYEGASYEAAALAVKKATGRGKDVVEYIKRLVVHFLIGNGDYHLKNISILRPVIGEVSLTPIYDAVNTQIYDLGDDRLALDLLIDDTPEAASHFGYETGNDFLELSRKLGVPEKVIRSYILKITSESSMSHLYLMVSRSELTDELKARYVDVLSSHAKILRNLDFVRSKDA